MNYWINVVDRLGIGSILFHFTFSQAGQGKRVKFYIFASASCAAPVSMWWR